LCLPSSVHVVVVGGYLLRRAACESNAQIRLGEDDDGPFVRALSPTVTGVLRRRLLVVFSCS
jgi:hypothetical protein